MPQTIIIFGASGDLAKLKIYPAILELYSQGFLESEFELVGYSRSKITNVDFQTIVKNSVLAKAKELNTETKILDEFIARCSYIAGQYDDQTDLENAFEQIKKPEGQIVCYFSVPPQVFEPLIVGLGALNKTYNIKAVIEKPFGVSEVSARRLYNIITDHFQEEQFYLLDHYLGKISVRDILALRQQNAILNLLLKGKHIKSVQISALETVGVENRLGYFDTVGSIRDMIQSHLLQVLALITMDLPINNASVSREKEHILASTQFHSTDSDLIVGQYEGYSDSDPSVKDSKTETLAIVKLSIDRQDWHNTPIYIRTGKKLGKKESKIVIEFAHLNTQNPKSPTNKLIVEFAPNESLGMELSHTFGMIQTSESIACTGPGCLGDYASLINDVFLGNHLHFVTFEQIIQSWRITDQILAFKESQTPIIYKPNQDLDFQNQIFGDTGSKWY